MNIELKKTGIEVYNKICGINYDDWTKKLGSEGGVKGIIKFV